jgi:ammonium transporter, Amt family
LERQAVGAFSVLLYSAVGTLIIALILKYTIGLRLTAEAEAVGIDESQHAESSCDFAAATGSGLPHAGLPDRSNGLEDRVGDKVEAE